MAEFLVRVISKVSGDVLKDVKLTKRGDVIVCMPDGHPWAYRETTLPEYRIFRWPTVSVEEGSALISEELPTTPTEPGMPPDPMLQRRGFYLDINNTKLPNQLKNYINDDSRASPYFDVPASITLASLKLQKPRRTQS